MTTEIGALTVQRSLVISAPPERIWEEFTSAERMQRWFLCRRLVLEPWVGGHFETEGDHGSIHYVFGGRVLTYDPPREVTVEWGHIPPHWPDVTLLTFRLLPEDSGHTRVEIIHHGFERLADQAGEVHASFENGWDLSELEALQRVIESTSR